MDNKVLKKSILGFVQIHTLHHAKEKVIYGAWMLEKLHEYGYEINAGTLYPILYNMEKNHLLEREDTNISGRTRKYY